MKLQRLLSLLRQAIDQYQMIEDGDHIAIGISGGKDSLTLLYGLASLQKFYPKSFRLSAITVDMGLDTMNLEPVKALCDGFNIPYEIISTDIGKILFEARKESNPCALCAKMRKGALNQKALELGCNKIALGHHFNDVIETTVMAMFYGAQLQAMLPKLHSSNFEGMELIRPMYCIHEEDIIRWKNAHGLEFIQCACRFTENCAVSEDGSGNSKRQEVKLLLKRLKKDNPDIEKSVFNSIHSVCLDTMPGWKTKGETHSFLENYDRG